MKNKKYNPVQTCPLIRKVVHRFSSNNLKESIRIQTITKQLYKLFENGNTK